MHDIGIMRVSGAMKPCPVAPPENDDDAPATPDEPSGRRCCGGRRNDLRPVEGLLVGTLLGLLLWIMFGLAMYAFIQLARG